MTAANPGRLAARRAECTTAGHLGCYTIARAGTVYTCHRYYSRVIDHNAFVIDRGHQIRWAEARTLAGCKAIIARQP
jgi:hypothetical protein